MMRSMFSGVSGLKAHQAKMDVIGNNIANVNTVGFKAQTVSFQEVFSQTIKGAGSPQTGRGGTNPQQIGLGVNVASMDVIHTQGSTQRTDNPTDVMIDGNGFFVVSPDGGLTKYYTRAGNFSLDKDGSLVTPGGLKVLGKQYDVLTGELVDENKPITINKGVTNPAEQSSQLTLSGNLNFNDPADVASNDIKYTTSIDVYDSVGNTRKVNVDFGAVEKTTNFTFRPVQFSLNSSSGTDVAMSGNTGNVPVTGTGDLYAAFDSTGAYVGLFSAVAEVAGPPVAPDPANAVASPALTISDATGNPNGVQDITLPLNDTMFSNLTHYKQDSSVKGTANGNAAGSIDSFNISSSGEVVAIFTNGKRATLAKISLAAFDNPPGLQKLGSNLFVDTPNSGTAKIGDPGTGSFGALVPGALEMSNVDLSQQFTEMITTQRGFQANSRIITTTDEMLQELVNLKR